MTSITWKSAEILKVDGTTIREGTFTGSKIYSDGVKTPDSPQLLHQQRLLKSMRILPHMFLSMLDTALKQTGVLSVMHISLV
jgi:hypothetical protein